MKETIKDLFKHKGSRKRLLFTLMVLLLVQIGVRIVSTVRVCQGHQYYSVAVIKNEPN